MSSSRKKKLIPLSKIIFSKSTTTALLDSDKDSSSNKKDFSPFWNKNTAIISNKLWMPTLTDTQNVDLVHLNSTSVPKKPLLSLFEKKRIINSIPDNNKLSSVHFTSDSVDNTPMILTEKIRI